MEGRMFVVMCERRERVREESHVEMMVSALRWFGDGGAEGGGIEVGDGPVGEGDSIEGESGMKSGSAEFLR